MTNKEADRRSAQRTFAGSALHIDDGLERNISQVLYERAQQVHFTPELQSRVLSQIKPKPFLSRTWKGAAYGLALALVLVIATIAYVSQSLLPRSIAYHIGTSVTAPNELAHGGAVVALDPTEQHLVYQPANQAGVMYMLDLAKPVESNLLAMNYARDAAWAPDGSALVATVAPANATVPLLAVVPEGHYMHPVGPTALAASWSPKQSQLITYAIQSEQTTQIWSTTLDGSEKQLLTTIPQALAVQHMLWTKDGQTLLLTVGETSALDQPARALYSFNLQTNVLQELVAPGAFTLGVVSLSPDNHYVSYEQIKGEQMIIQVNELAQPHDHFSIVPKGLLQGWSWSPDSHALIYSDAGVLYSHVLQGAAIQLPKTDGALISPFWLKDGRILCMQVLNGQESLFYLVPQR
ncbi:hypothetical protein [Tengunoibacter tsumagoiensis]|uniref:Lipoprotein LpqB beta-propeller domain-containing protein n=1 Tax=Tengunoibacter tsumagoiensis TaxID=2014871 RepID=A0A401ZVN7_9CHLR|nr:hypothetical protein [Tengunoibacter tsumagoiensis]GCE10969.1 hypothetical protein KTT_08280 [Tengunoibacter tsumagoiensis]